MAQDIVNENQKISYTNLDFSAIYTETLDLIKQLTYRWDPSISDESDPGVVLVKLSALLADKLNYNIDKNILETFPLSVTQEGNARQLYDQLGYYMDWYISGQTTVNISWKGDTDLENIQTYKIPKFTPVSDTEQTSSKRYTLVGVQGAEDIVVSDFLLSTDGNIIQAIAMEGFPVQYQYAGESVITAQMVDPLSRRLYFTTKYISQNGVFIKNTNQENFAEWHRVNNLYENSFNELRYMFGYDSYTDTCYLEFPDNYAELIGSGIEITYLVIDPTAGDVMSNELVQFMSPINVSVSSIDSDGVTSTTEIILNSDNVKITNVMASTGHADTEGLNEAYKNYKRTVGTFKTLITLRDYLNYIRSEDLDICSNAFVCDRTNDVQTVYKIMSKQRDMDNIVVKVEKILEDTEISSSFNYKFIKTEDVVPQVGKKYYRFNSDGTEMEEIPAPENPHEAGCYEVESVQSTEVDAVEPFTLKFYLLKKSISVDSQSAYNETFNPLYPNPDFSTLFSDTAHLEHTYGEILSVGKDFLKLSSDEEFDENKAYYQYNSRTEKYELITEDLDGNPSELGVYDVRVEALMPHTCFFKAVYPVSMNISTYSALDSDTQNLVLSNIVSALYERTSSKDIEFGDEVSLDWVADIAKDSDTRIKSVSISPLTYYLYAVYFDKDQGAFVEVQIDSDLEFAPQSYQSEADIISAKIKKDVMAKSILAGTSQLIIPDTEFLYHLPQKFISFREGINAVTTEAIIDLDDDSVATTYITNDNNTYLRKTYTLKDNETVTLFRPEFENIGEWLAGIHYEYVLKDTVKANSSHKLESGEYFILYDPLKDSTDNSVTGYTAHCIGPGSIIYTTFKLLPQTSTSSLSNFAKAQILPYFVINPTTNYYMESTSNNTYVTEIRNSSIIVNNVIQGTDAIRLQRVNSITLEVSDKYKYLWMLNKTTYSSNDNIKSYVLFDSYNSEEDSMYADTINTYTLKNGEFLVYYDPDFKNPQWVGAGTTIVRNCGVDSSEYIPFENSTYFIEISSINTLVSSSTETSKLQIVDNGYGRLRVREAGYYEFDWAVEINSIFNALDFDDSAEYAINDIAIYDGTYYRCLEEASGEWDSLKWEKITINWRETQEEISELASSDFSPYKLGFYELIDDYYFLSQDEFVDSTKEYYITHFIRTNDTLNQDNKHYYYLAEHKEEGLYYRHTATDEDGVVRTVYDSDPIDSGSFTEIDIKDYNNPIIYNPVNEGWYKRQMFNGSYLRDSYPLYPGADITEQYRFVHSAKIRSNSSVVGDEYLENDSTTVNWNILADTKYANIDISDVTTYTDIDLGSDDFDPATNRLLEPTYRQYYRKDGDEYKEISVSYLTNPYEEDLYVVDSSGEYHSCQTEDNYFTLRPEVVSITLTDSAALMKEIVQTYNTDVNNKGYFYKANKNGTIYYYKGNSYAWCNADDVLGEESTVSPMDMLYNHLITYTTGVDTDEESSEYLARISNQWSDSISFQRPYLDEESITDFSPTTVYAYNTTVRYNGKYYRYMDNNTSGEWDDSKWIEVSINWRFASFTEYTEKTIENLTDSELSKYWIKVKASDIINSNVKVGTIHPACDGDIIDSNFYVQALYRNSLGIDKTKYPYTLDDMVGNTLQTDGQLLRIFPNREYELSKYGTVRLCYMPKLFKFKDFVRFTDTKYFIKTDLYNRICEPIDAWSCTPVDIDVLSDDLVDVGKNYIVPLQTNCSLSLIANKTETFGSGDKLIFEAKEAATDIVWPVFSNTPTKLDDSQYDIYYQRKEKEISSLEYIRVDDYSWRGYSNLVLNSVSKAGQVLAGNHSISVYENANDATPVEIIRGSDGSNVSIQFRDNVTNASGEFIDVYNIDATSKESVSNAIYVYEPFVDTDYYKYNTTDNTTSLLFNNYYNKITEEYYPQEITVPFGLPGGKYLLSCNMKNNITMTVICNNTIEIGGRAYNLDAPVVSGGYDLDGNYVNYLTSYYDGERTEFTGDHYEYLYMYTGDGMYRKITAPSLIARSVSPEEAGFYEKDSEGNYSRSTRTEIGANLLDRKTFTEDEIDSHDENPSELGWYELYRTSYRLTSDTSVQVNKTYAIEPELYVAVSDINSELVFNIDYDQGMATYTLSDIFKFEENSAITHFDLLQKKVRDLDVDDEYNYTYVPADNDLITNPLEPKSFFNTNHVFNKNIIAQLDFDNLDARFTTIR